MKDLLTVTANKNFENAKKERWDFSILVQIGGEKYSVRVKADAKHFHCSLQDSDTIFASYPAFASYPWVNNRERALAMATMATLRFIQEEVL